MGRARGHIRELAVASGLGLGIVAMAWAQQGAETIGTITIIQRAVTVTHGNAPMARPIRARQALVPEDTLRTGEGARAQALFEDDTMLTLGQQTQAQISEYLHDSAQHVRRMTVLLTRGTMRALVGRDFSGVGSTFTIRAGSVSIVANTVYCVVWSNDRETGVANIGTKGPVSLVAQGKVVILDPGFYAIAPSGQPPGKAAATSGAAPTAVQRAIDDTEVGDQLNTPVEALAEEKTVDKLPACPPGSPPGGVCPREPVPPALPPTTPPAVTSGAVPR